MIARRMLVVLVLMALPVCYSGEPPEDYGINTPKMQFPPAEVLSKAGEYVISRLGQEWFETHCQFRDLALVDNRGLVTGPKEERALFYACSWTVMPWHLDLVVWLNMDMSIREKGTQVPDCIAEPARCMFAIDREEAVRIARAELFGDTEWCRAHQIWSDEIQGYAWFVNGGSGTVIVDSGTGAVVPPAPASIDTSSIRIQLPPKSD